MATVPTRAALPIPTCVGNSIVCPNNGVAASARDLYVHTNTDVYDCTLGHMDSVRESVLKVHSGRKMLHAAPRSQTSVSIAPGFYSPT